MNYSKQIRTKFYDILLHKYLDLENLNVGEIIKILKRTIHKIDHDKTIDLNEFESIAKLHSLNGRDLASIRNGETFAHIFSSINCDSSIWERVYQTEMTK